MVCLGFKDEIICNKKADSEFGAGLQCSEFGIRTRVSAVRGRRARPLH